MALSDQDQQRLLDAVLDIQTQLRGPGLAGWPQLGQNAKGQNLTEVDALARIENILLQLQAAQPVKTAARPRKKVEDAPSE